MDSLSPVSGFDFQPWRNALPAARGARLSDADIVGITHTTLLQSHFFAKQDGSDKSWIDDPSIVPARLFTTFVNGDKKRKYGGLYRGTHNISVAHKSENRERFPADRVSRIMAAFDGVHHDNLEDISQNPKTRAIALSIILEGWQGNPGLRPTLKREILSLTDTPGLWPKKRFKEQIERARVEMTSRSIGVRYEDKYDNIGSDYYLVLKGIISDPREIIERARLARDKVSIIMALPNPITDDEKRAYLKITESLEAAARAAKQEIAATPDMLARSMRSAAAIYRGFTHLAAAWIL